MPTTTTAAELRAFLRAGPTVTDAELEGCLATAAELIGAAVGQAEIPAAVVAQAQLETGAELYRRRDAPAGLSQYVTGLDAPGQGPARGPRDPLAPAWPLLSRYVVPF